MTPTKNSTRSNLASIKPPKFFARWRWPIVILGAVLLVAALVVAIYLLRGTSIRNYDDSRLGLAFQYPSSVQLKAHVEDLDDGSTALYITASTGKMTTYATPEQAELDVGVIGQLQTGETFDAAVRRINNDPGRLLVLGSCPESTAMPCLQVKDQKAWDQSHSGFINTGIYLEGPQKIYGVEFGQQNTVGYKTVGLDMILQTLRPE